MELYHLLNRGVDKRNIFMDDSDRARFVHDMFEFNDIKLAGNAYRRFSGMMGLRNPSFAGRRERIVDIHGWVLMKNHYHLLVSERVEGGMTRFVRKLNVGYANYFNERYERSGALFQGRTKKVLINSDAHFLHILHYIHLNPLDFASQTKEWRSGHISGAWRAIAHLDSYRWSSYLDYCGKKNFPSILTTALFQDVFSDIEKKTKEYLQDIDIESVRHLVLEDD